MLACFFVALKLTLLFTAFMWLAAAPQRAYTGIAFALVFFWIKHKIFG